MAEVPELVVGGLRTRLSDLFLLFVVLHEPRLRLGLDVVAIHRRVDGSLLESPQLALRKAERVTGPTAGAHLPLLGEDVLLADMAVLHDGALHGLFGLRQLCRGVLRGGPAAGIAADCKPLASP